MRNIDRFLAQLNYGLPRDVDVFGKPVSRINKAIQEMGGSGLNGHPAGQRTIDIKDIREGSIVSVRGGFGTEQAANGRVLEVSQNIKNGRPGIEYESNNETRWAYLDQVQRVVQY